MLRSLMLKEKLLAGLLQLSISPIGNVPKKHYRIANNNYVRRWNHHGKLTDLRMNFLQRFLMSCERHCNQSLAGLVYYEIQILKSIQLQQLNPYTRVRKIKRKRLKICWTFLESLPGNCSLNRNQC